MKQEPKQHVELINDNIDEFDEKIKEFKQIDQTNPVTRGSTALVKQETLEEVAEIIYHTHKTPLEQANEIIKLLQERSYSEEDMLQSFLAGIKCESKYGKNFEQFIKQFKNK